MKASIDRFEKDRVILTFENSSKIADIPREILPPHCEEGDILEIKIKRDQKGSKTISEEVSHLITKISKKKLEE